MESSALKRRYVSFYLDDLGAHQTLPVEGEICVKGALSGDIGTFPREPGETFSWYLCGCGTAAEPYAWRAKGPTDLTCKVCNASPEEIFVCSCGVASPVRGEAECAWCGRRGIAPGHVCRGFSGSARIVHDAAVCPLCKEVSEAARPHSSPAAAIGERAATVASRSQEAAVRRAALVAVAPAVASEVRPAPRLPAVPKPISRPLTATAPLAAAVSTQAAVPKPAEATSAAAAGPPGALVLSTGVSRSRRALWLGLAAVGAALATYWIHGLTPYARAEAALERGGDLLAPAGDSAVDLYESVAKAEPGSERVRELGRRIAAVLRPEADEVLQRFYLDSPDNTDWPRLERMYGVLAAAAPDDKVAQARERYCAGQIALGQRRFQESLDADRAALALVPGWPLALNGIAKVYVRADPPLRDLARARDFYQQAHRADPRFIYPLINLAQLAALDNQLDQAAAYLAEALAIDGKRPNLYRDLARVERKRGRIAEALQAYTNSLNYETNPEMRNQTLAVMSELRRKARRR